MVSKEQAIRKKNREKYQNRVVEVSIARKQYYSKNRDYILEYVKNRYSTDQRYRKAKIDKLKQRIKERYENNEDYRNIHKNECEDIKIVGSKERKPLIETEPCCDQCTTEFQTETEYSQADVQENGKVPFSGKVKCRPQNGNVVHSENMVNNDASHPPLKRQSQEAKILYAKEEILKDREKPTLCNQDYESNTKFQRIFNESSITSEIPRNEDKDPLSTVADNLSSYGIQNSISEGSGDADEISREIFLQEQMHQQSKRDSFWPQSVKINERKRVQELIANYVLCNSQENIKDNGSSKPSSVANTFQSPKTSHSSSLDFPTIIDSHTSQKCRGNGNFLQDLHQASRIVNTLDVEKSNKLGKIQALFPKPELRRERRKEAARTYRRKQKDYFLELERQVIANIDVPVENIRAASIRGDAIDILRERESPQTKNISGGEIPKPLDLSTRSQTGGSSFSNTLNFEEDAIDILREKESFQSKNISGGEIPELLDLSTRSQAGSSFSITRFEEAKTGIAEPDSLSALQESTNNFGIMKWKNQEGKNVECFDGCSLKSRSNFKELDSKNVLVRQEEITLKGLTRRTCHQNLDDCLSAREKEAKRKETNRIAAKKYRMNKKMKLQELEETIVKLEALHRGKILQ